MRYRRFMRCAIPALLLPAAATAQSRPGISFEQTTHTVTTGSGRTDSTSNVTRTTTAGNNARIDLVKGEFMAFGPLSPGPHGVMIMRDGGKEMVFLNPDQKQFVSIKPIEMMEAAQKMLEGMGNSLSVDTSASRVNMDSVGPGSAIDGHPTLTYRLTAVARMTMSTMGESHVVDTQLTQEFQTATDMDDLVGMSTGVNAFAHLSQLAGFPKGYLDKIAAAGRRMRGFPLRTVKHTTTSTSRGITRTAVETVEARNVRRLTVPDSLFVVPGDYKPVTVPGFPGASR